MPWENASKFNFIRSLSSCQRLHWFFLPLVIKFTMFTDIIVERLSVDNCLWAPVPFNLSDRIVRMSKNSTKYILSMVFKVPSSIALYKDSIAFLFPSSESVVKATIALLKRFWTSSRQESQFLRQSKLLNLSILLPFLVQFLNSPFFPPHIEGHFEQTNAMVQSSQLNYLWSQNAVLVKREALTRLANSNGFAVRER